MAQPLWYLRHAGTTLGPYPAPQVQELLYSGAIAGNWEISLDGQDWLPLQESGHFDAANKAHRPEDHVTQQNAWSVERQRARDRWRDEDENTFPPHDMQVDEARRRALERDQERTETLVQAEHTRRPSLLIGLLALLALGAAGAVVWLGQSEEPIPAALNQAVNCAAPAAEGINWSGCDKRGATLAGALLRNARLQRTRLEDARLAGAILEYANAGGAQLRNADLQGAKLIAADLTGADLSGADLSGANLRYAVLKGTRLAGTRLDNTTWSDGRSCAAGSIGVCR
jgi:hypothetical protein